MIKISDSNLDTYANDFWIREKRKGNSGPENERDPVGSLKKVMPYKLPQGEPVIVGIWELQTKDEVLSLAIHKYMLEDALMTRKGLANLTEENPTSLATIGQTTLSRNYFGANAGDIQAKYYQHWKSRGSFQGTVPGSLSMIPTADQNLQNAEKPLIERINGSDEIVDGWGRLLPVAALLLEGMNFTPIRMYLAHPPGNPFD